MNWNSRWRRIRGFLAENRKSLFSVFCFNFGFVTEVRPRGNKETTCRLMYLVTWQPLWTTAEPTLNTLSNVIHL